MIQSVLDLILISFIMNQCFICCFRQCIQVLGDIFEEWTRWVVSDEEVDGEKSRSFEQQKEPIRNGIEGKFVQPNNWGPEKEKKERDFHGHKNIYISSASNPMIPEGSRWQQCLYPHS